MKLALIVVGGLFGLGILTVAIVAMLYFHYDGMEIGLRNELAAQQKSNEVSFDNTWKIVQQQAGVVDQYKESFRQIYVDLMQGRHYEAGGNFMKWIKEANPTFDASLFKNLINSIAAERKSFERNQNKLIDLQRAHTDVITKAPSRFFVGGRSKIEIQVVTSTKTEKTFQTGKEDDIDVFQKKK